MKKSIKYVLISILAISAIGGAIGFYFYTKMSDGFAIDKTVYILIDDKKEYESIRIQIDTLAKAKSMTAFDMAVEFTKYKDAIKAGRYAITPETTILEAVSLMRSGKQTPVKLTFNNIRTKDDLAERISEQLMFDKKELLDAFNNPEKCKQLGFNTETMVAMFIPNTYEFYWTVSVEAFLEKMDAEYTKFWTEERLAKAKAMNLNSIEVSTLASIVEEECTYTDEYPIVAGLYYNRIKRDQMLQADPTVKFAVGDFSLRRILNKHLEVESPYNTYKQAGLPPGPIRVPSIKGIESVLNYNHNNYYFMCAKDDLSGRHNFATTHAEHQANATKYWQALNKRKIYK